jgi:hypothetical protein
MKKALLSLALTAVAVSLLATDAPKAQPQNKDQEKASCCSAAKATASESSGCCSASMKTSGTCPFLKTARQTPAKPVLHSPKGAELAAR